MRIHKISSPVKVSARLWKKPGARLKLRLTVEDLTAGLYLGGWQATDAQAFTHVLTIMEGIEIKHGQKLKAHKVIALQDVPSSNLLDHFPEGIKFLESALAEGGLVYVHCAAGVSRSATVIPYMRMCACACVPLCLLSIASSLCIHTRPASEKF